METHPKLNQPGKIRRLTPFAVAFAAGILAVATVLGGYAWENKSVGKVAVEFFARTLGYDAFMDRGANKIAALRALPGNYFRNVDIPKMVLDIKFEHWQKILAKRAKALASGGLVQEDGDFVPASIRYADGKAKVKVRLKGDHLDHLEGDKWSFRIKTRNKDHVYGMRRFSLQKPEAREFQLTPMMLALTKSLGLIPARYMFVDLTINGDRIGTMALEEHPAKEMLEASGRKDSVIIRFSEKYFWNWYNKGGTATSSFSPFNDYRFAPIDAFQSSRIQKSAVLSRHQRVSSGLLRGFSEGRLPASKVFDADLMGRFLAVTELFGAWHGIRWHNLRFYFNPLTSLLEPLPFDFSSELKWGSFVTSKEPITRDMLRDPNIKRSFHAHLKSLIGRVRSGEVTKLLKEAEARHLPHLQKEYLLHGRYPLNRLVKRASMLEERLLGNKGAAPIRYDQLLFAREYSDQGKRVLSLTNAMTQPVTVKRVYLARCKGAQPDRTEAIAASRLPVTLPAANPNGLPDGVKLQLSEGLGRNCAMLVDSHLAGSDRIKTVTVDPDTAALDASPIPEGTLSAALADREFLTYQAAEKTLSVAAGNHMVGRDMIVPAGTTLAIGAGTTLRFAPGVAIIAHGPVAFRGTAAAPITLRPTDAKKGWQGIAVMRAGARSEVRHTRIIRTTGVDKPGWSLTGGVTFYESDVDIVGATFRDHNGEDALNIVRSDFVIDATSFDTTLSDAFDSDFSSGRITISTFSYIGSAGGGDAVDTSGSVVEIIGATFRQISDKAISVGEASTVTVRDVVIDDTGTGLASKDRSTLKASNVTIKGAKFAALTAYIKKPEYGGATIIADDITIVGGNTRNLVQTGSRIVLAGRELDTQDIDIDALYDTVMKPGAR